jgi:hypothetical protein
LPTTQLPVSREHYVALRCAHVACMRPLTARLARAQPCDVVVPAWVCSEIRASQQQRVRRRTPAAACAAAVPQPARLLERRLQPLLASDAQQLQELQQQQQVQQQRGMQQQQQQQQQSQALFPMPRPPQQQLQGNFQTASPLPAPRLQQWQRAAVQSSQLGDGDTGQPLRYVQRSPGSYRLGACAAAAATAASRGRSQRTPLLLRPPPHISLSLPLCCSSRACA